MKTWQVGALGRCLLTLVGTIAAVAVLCVAPAASQNRDRRDGPGRPDPGVSPRREERSPGREAPAPRVEPSRERESAPRWEPSREQRPAPRREEPAPRVEPSRERGSTPRWEPSREQGPAPRRDEPGRDRNPSQREERDRERPSLYPGMDGGPRNPSRRDERGAGGTGPDSARGPSDRRGPDGGSPAPRIDRAPTGRTPDGGRNATEPRRDVYDRGRRGADVYADPRPRSDRAHAIFTRSSEGRRYETGVALRPSYRIQDVYVRRYFRTGECHFPYYWPTYQQTVVYFSPYSVYYGVCPPYLLRRYTYYRRPTVIYIEVPIYRDRVFVGFDSYRDDYYLSDRVYRLHDGDLPQAVRDAFADIEEAFRYSDIDLLARYADPSTRIAVFRNGEYEYSLHANDYLDMTRDAMREWDTLSFDLYRVRRRSDGVYVASGRHDYRDREGRRRTVYVSFAVERLFGRWVLTQVGTAPDRIQDL